MKKGNADEVLFSKPAYNAIGDPYRDPKYHLRGQSAKPTRAFVPSGGPKKV